MERNSFFLLLLSVFLLINFHLSFSQQHSKFLEGAGVGLDEEEFDEDAEKDEDEKEEEAIDADEFEIDTQPQDNVPSSTVPTEVKAEVEIKYDDDEFIVDTPQKESQSPSNLPNEAIDSKEEVKHVQFSILAKKSWILEISYALFLVVYGINYFYGKSRNEKIATVWGRQYLNAFRNQFSKVGSDALLTKVSASEFTMKATGRRHCFGLNATLNLIKRQDLFSLIMGVLKGGLHDTLTFDIPLKKCKNNYVFAIVRKKDEQKYLTDNQDIKTYTTISDTKALPAHYVVFSDGEEVTDRVLKILTPTIRKFDHYFLSMHVTDNSKYVTYKHFLRFVFKLPDKEKMESISELQAVALKFIDDAYKLQLSPAALKVTTKKRAMVAEAAEKATQAQKQEEAQQRKIEKKQKEQEKVASLSKDQQRRYDEKEYKKKMKKRMPKYKQTKVVF